MQFWGCEHRGEGDSGGSVETGRAKKTHASADKTLSVGIEKTHKFPCEAEFNQQHHLMDGGNHPAYLRWSEGPLNIPGGLRGD